MPSPSGCGLSALAAWCLKHRVITTVAAAGFFFGSFALVPLLPTGFLPPDDLSQTQVYLSCRPAAPSRKRWLAAERAREIVQQHPHAKMVYTAVGGGAAGSDPFMPRGASEVRKATLTINMTPRSQRGGVTKQTVERELREDLTALPGRA